MVRVHNKFCNKTKPKEGCLSRRTEGSTLEVKTPDEKTSSFPEGSLCVNNDFVKVSTDESAVIRCLEKGQEESICR